MSHEIHERVAEKERLLHELRHEIEQLRSPMVVPLLLFGLSVLACLWAFFQLS